MRVLIDTNVILDVLCNRTDFVEASGKIWKLCEIGKIEGTISALSIPNLVYILRKELDPEKIEEVIERLSLIFTVCDLRAEDLKKAAGLRFGDYEDALQSVAAARLKADYIVTRNGKDFADSTVRAISPIELLHQLSESK